LKLLDYLTSPSGGELVTVGVEGEIFTWDAAGKPVYPELKDVPSVTINVLSDKYGLWLANMYLRGDDRSVYYNYTEKEQEAQDKINNGNHYEPLDPILKFKDEEMSIIAELKTSLQKSANEFSAKYILTKSSDDKEWQDWLKNAEKLGASKLEDIYNAAQKRFDAGN
ncbi:MAG TPA: ABC transporter substrate-binding protein, partial [Bacilli bacterium]